MFRIFAIISVLILATMACSMGGNNDPTITPASFGRFPTTTPNIQIVTNTPSPTTAPSATPFNNNNNPGSGSSPCRIRTDWYLYIVQRGDTLSQIARAVGSDTTTLTNANCLINPNSLEVGQQIRVPRMPQPPTITPVPSHTPSDVNTVGNITFSEVVNQVGQSVTVASGKTIGLTYPQASASLHHVNFVLRSPNGTVGDVFAADYNLGDGANVAWTVPSSLQGHQLVAEGYTSNGRLLQMSTVTYVYTSWVDEGYVSISPIAGGDGGSIILQPGATVTVSYEGARWGLARAEFALYNPNTDGWSTVGIDTNLSDGVSVTWVVPNGLDGHVIWASTYFSDGVQAQRGQSAHLFSAGQSTNTGAVSIFPYVEKDTLTYKLTPNQPVTITWAQVPATATRVDFIMTPTGTGGADAAQIIGSDSVIADGASISWTPPVGILAHIYAVAAMPDGRSVETAQIVNVWAE